MTTPQVPPPSDRLGDLGRNRQPVAVGLMAAGAILEVVALVLLLTLKGEAGAEAFGCFLLGVGCFGAGLWFYLYQDNAFTPAEAGRFLVLLVGGALGLSLTLAILARAWLWSATIFGGIEAWQGANGWRVWLVLLGTLVGLAVMFVSLLLARTEEQSNPSLRRLLYGYNAFLSGFLLLIILVIVNLVSYQYIPARADYTDLRIYTLNPESQNILKGLEKPVKVYVLLDSPESRFMGEMQNLEDNCRNVTDKIRFENIVRDSMLRRVAELTRKYNLVDDLGMLVVYGNEEENSSHFIKLDSLFTRGEKSVEFQGENELMSAIKFLQENKTKPILYFTQANGELDLGSGDARNLDRRATILKERLSKDNYDVRALKLGAAGNRADAPGVVAAGQVPDDAAAVVIAGPRIPFSDQAIAALDAYMNPKEPTKKKGKLVVLLDPLKPADGAGEGSGLEAFLTKFNVEVGNNRILDLNGRPPQRVIVIANPALRESNPVAAALENVPMVMLDSRTIQPSGGGERPPMGMNFRPDELLFAFPSRGQVIFTETNLNADPVTVVEELIADLQKGNQQKLLAKNPTSRLPVGLAVSEGGGGMPPMMNPHMPQPPSTPRLLVIGNSGFISDADLRRSPSPNYEVLAGSIAWLRERPSNIGLKAREHKEYQMEANTNLWRLVFLPAALMMITILGLGLGIWVVRRR